MNYTEEILSEKKIIIFRFTGDYGVKLMDELGIKFRTRAFDLGYSLIIDITKGNSKITLNDGLKALKKYDKSEYKRLRKVPVAIVVNSNQYVFFKVIEQFVVNTKGDFKAFKEMDTAIDWFTKRSKR
tara:strand:- start:119 stop:499 length:381 start_codon:yes stop_codon:yes gene_type:complete